MFTNELNKYMEQHTLVEVYSNPQDTSKFSVGYILACDESFFAMSSISKHGKLDGFQLKNTEDIIRLCEGTVYLQKMSTLLRYHNEKQASLTLGRDLVYDFLDYCKANNRIVAVEVVDSHFWDTIGYIDAIDDDRCTISQISDQGKSDGISYVITKDITNISCGSEDEVMLEILNSELFDERRFG